MAEEKFSSRGITGNVFFAGMVSLLMDVSSEMVYPLVPVFLTSVLGATMTTVGLIEGVAESTASLLKVFSGWISDRLGRRKLLMTLGYGISVASRPLIAASRVWPEVMGARFIDRVGKGVRTAPRDAIIAESTSRATLATAFGFHRMMDTVGAALGPAVAFAVLSMYSNDLRLLFYLSTIPAALAVLTIIFFIKEKGPVKTGAHLPPLVASLNSAFRRYIIVTGIFSLAAFSDAFLIVRARGLGIGAALIPVIYLLYNVLYATLSVPMGALADRVGLKRMVLGGFIFYSIIYLAFALSTRAIHIWFLFPLYGVYKAMSEGNQRAYLAAVAPAEKKATAFGLFHTVTGVMLLPSSIIAGLFWDRIGPEAAFFFASALSLAAALVFALPVQGIHSGHRA